MYFCMRSLLAFHTVAIIYNILLEIYAVMIVSVSTLYLRYILQIKIIVHLNFSCLRKKGIYFTRKIKCKGILKSTRTLNEETKKPHSNYKFFSFLTCHSMKFYDK